MVSKQERILVVENDQEISDLIARQTLQPMGYHVDVAKDAAAAIQDTARLSPDLIIANLHLPGLSGKDLLAALSSQELDIPVIVMATKVQGEDLIQAFRLGASDFLIHPIREAEVVSAVERVLKQVRLRREREALANQLTRTNQELQQRVRELTTILAIGKAVTSIKDQRPLLEKIMEGAIFVTEADSGWLLLRQDNTNNYILSAFRNLPQEISNKLNQSWDDGISALVNLSGESLSITGEPLMRFKLSRIWQSALVVPIKVKNEVMGIIVVVRKAARPFSQSCQALVEAVADYASIALVNIRLVQTLEERVQTLKRTVENARSNERKKEEAFARTQEQVNAPLAEALDSVSALLLEEEGKLKPKPKNLLRTAQDKLLQATRVLRESNQAPTR